MADFLQAYKITRGHEGGYVVDGYSETYAGITRKGYPKWQGWQLIDGWKKIHGTPAPGTVFNIEGLDLLVLAFYKKFFWERMLGDAIKNQTIANFIFDFSVNSYSAFLKINRALGARVTNNINEDSLTIINERPGFAYSAILQARKNIYDRNKKTRIGKKNYRGWIARLNKFPKQLATV